MFWLSYECFSILCNTFLLKSAFSSHNSCEERCLDTEEDVKQRKVLAMNVVNLLKEIFFGDINIEVKVCSFNCYVSSVFLYNCKTWTLTKTLEITRLVPAKVAEKCGSQCQMAEYCHQ